MKNIERVSNYIPFKTIAVSKIEIADLLVNVGIVIDKELIGNHYRLKIYKCFKEQNEYEFFSESDSVVIQR